MELYRPFFLQTADLIREEAKRRLTEEAWDYRSEKIIRMRNDDYTGREVNKELASLELPKLGLWSIFARGPYEKQIIHVDAIGFDTRVNSGFIVPVMGCKGSKFQWFDETEIDLTPVYQQDKRSTLFKKISPNQPQMIDELEVLETHICRLNVPHRAVAGPEPRVIVSIKLFGNPVLI